MKGKLKNRKEEVIALFVDKHLKEETIAKKLGVSRQAVNYFLYKNIQNKYEITRANCEIRKKKNRMKFKCKQCGKIFYDLKSKKGKLKYCKIS